MPLSRRPDRYPGYNFEIAITGLSEAIKEARGFFSEASELEVEVPPIEYRNGSEDITVRKVPGQKKFTNITLKRGITRDLEFWNWILQAMNGQVNRTDGFIALLDESRQEVMRWNFRRGWPCRYTGPGLNAANNEIAIETLELCHEGLEIGPLPVTEARTVPNTHDLAALARKIEPVCTWKDIVLPEDTLAQLREICQRVAHQHQVVGDWGFGKRLALGALFVGPAGTGKTMAAEVIANELQLDLYKVDLSSVVSKYIGETEKNLDRIFKVAENSDVILLLDEGDSLFGKRSEVRDSHDRYANSEISYLLQKMEQYKGVVILATNLRQDLDDAFVRRLAFAVHFPFPDEASRRRIWGGIWPEHICLADDVGLDYLARHFKLTGGNIKNIALVAEHLATKQDGRVTMSELLDVTRSEYQKMGKLSAEN